MSLFARDKETSGETKRFWPKTTRVRGFVGEEAKSLNSAVETTTLRERIPQTVGIPGVETKKAEGLSLGFKR